MGEAARWPFLEPILGSLLGCWTFCRLAQHVGNLQEMVHLLPEAEPFRSTEREGPQQCLKGKRHLSEEETQDFSLGPVKKDNCRDRRREGHSALRLLLAPQAGLQDERPVLCLGIPPPCRPPLPFPVGRGSRTLDAPGSSGEVPALHPAAAPGCAVRSCT